MNQQAEGERQGAGATDPSPSEDRAAGVVHTLVALGVLLLFFSALGFNFLPALVPSVLHSVQTVRTIGAEQVASGPFDVRNSSGASVAQIAGILHTLEQDLVAINSFTAITPTNQIPVLITDGIGPALADGTGLNIFYDNGVLNLDTAPFFLVLLADGKGIDFGGNLALQAGYAIYVSEEVGRAQQLSGQPVDAWMKLLIANDNVVPLDELHMVGIPRNEDDLFVFLRAMLEGGSFVRWVAKTHGIAVAQRLRSGEDIATVLGMSSAEAEQEWLSAVSAVEVGPRTCALALPPLFPRSLCSRLESNS